MKPTEAMIKAAIDADHKWTEEHIDDDPGRRIRAVLEAALAPEPVAGEAEALGRALAECASPFNIGSEKGLIDFETLAREFNRRQRIAATALGRPLASELSRPSDNGGGDD